MKNLFRTKRSLAARLALTATALAIIVVLLGAYTRLKDAGLGCPDWPGCYGQLQVPHTDAQLQRATLAFPQQTVEQNKAWPEMLHRYAAGTLATFSILLALLIYRRPLRKGRSLVAALCLIGLILFQALLGMWTVTLLLYPPIVMGHLLAGMTLTAVLWWLAIDLNHFFSDAQTIHIINPAYLTPTQSNMPITLSSLSSSTPHHSRLRIAATVALAILALQIALGAWTSANYAGPSCPDFPACQGSMLPKIDMAKGFNLAVPLGNNFQGGVLDNAGRMAIHIIHRLGAFMTLLVVGGLSAWLIRFARNTTLKAIGIIIALLLLGQISLGISLVLFQFPLPLGVMHNGMALLLLLSLVTLNAYLYQTKHYSLTPVPGRLYD